MVMNKIKTTPSHFFIQSDLYDYYIQELTKLSNYKNEIKKIILLGNYNKDEIIYLTRIYQGLEKHIANNIIEANSKKSNAEKVIKCSNKHFSPLSDNRCSYQKH